MAWAKVDDQWFASRKIVPLTLAARGLWTTVLSWTCAQRSPHAPGHMVAFLAGGQPIDDEIDALEDAGLWHGEGHDCPRCDQPDPGGWIIHDWDDYQEQDLSEKRAEAGAKGGRKSGETRRKKADEDADEDADEANGKQTTKQTKQTNEANDEAGTRPGPSRPVPTPPDQGQEREPPAPKKRRPEAPLPDDWAPTEAHQALAVDQGVDLDHEAAKFADHAAANDRRQRDWDAAFRTWLRRARDYGATNSQPRASPGSRGPQHAGMYRQAAAELERQAG